MNIMIPIAILFENNAPTVATPNNALITAQPNINKSITQINSPIVNRVLVQH